MDMYHKRFLALTSSYLLNVLQIGIKSTGVNWHFHDVTIVAQAEQAQQLTVINDQGLENISIDSFAISFISKCQITKDHVL